MADFSLTTFFVVPVGQATYPSTGSTQDLTAGQVGFFNQAYVALTSGTIAAADYFYVAQGRTNTYLQGSKRSDKIKGCPTANCRSNVTEWYKVTGCPYPTVQITEIDDWHVKCGDILTLTIRAHSSYLDTLYFNGLTRSVTVVAPCCECDGDPCEDVDVDDLIDNIMEQLTGHHVTSGVIDWDSPLSEYGPTGINPDRIMLNTFFTFSKSGSGATAKLVITGKALTSYGLPCDISAFPYEYDRMWFRTFVYSGPATTADFIVSDACNIVADSTIIQTSNYAKGTAAEMKQLEKNYYSYQVGYLKHLYKLMGYNGNFESWVTDGTTYDTYYIKFNEYDKSAYQWGDYIEEDAMVIIAVAKGSAEASALSTILTAALGAPADESGVCVTTTSTTTAAATTTTTTTAAATTTTTSTAQQ
jgi:hypothetical protein